MANTKRRYIDRNGSMFVPMNVEGGSYDEHFMTTSKLVSLGASIFTGIALIAWLKGRYAGPMAYVIIMGMFLVAFQFVLRYVIFDEKFYYRMYKNLKESEISTPAIFWDIASIKEIDDGVIMTYADGKIGILIKLERDTITGKNEEFKEEHYDAISDFYKELIIRKYSFVQMNIMEQAGNDPRLAELDKLTFKSNNSNVCKLMEMQIGYTKNVTHRTLYESDYVLVYTKDLTRTESIVNDAMESVYKIMDGAFIGFKILSSRDIVEFIKEEYGVRYFNYTEATLAMFKNHNMLTRKPFEVSAIEYSDGEIQKIEGRELNIINSITSGVLSGTIDISNISIKDTLLSKSNKKEFEVNFDSLAGGFENTNKDQTGRADVIKGFTKKKKNDKPKTNDLNELKNEENESIDDFNTFEERSVEAAKETFNNIGLKNQQENKSTDVSDEDFNDESETIDF